MFDNKNINNLANNLKFLREKSGLSLSQLSKHTGITKQSLSYYERGERIPDVHNLIKIAVYYNTSIDSIIFSNSDINLKELKHINYDEYSSNLLEELKHKLIKTNKLNSKIIELLSQDNSNKNEEYSKELSISSETIDKIINLDKYKLKNSIDIDFYKNNNLKICDSLNSNFAYSNQEQLEYISVYGNISCGALKYTNGSIEDYFYLHKNDLKYDKSDYFILQIDGESMNKLYKNGDYILIHKTKNYEGYKPYVFILDDEATLKYIDIDLENRNIILVPHSTYSSYQNQILKFEDLNSTNFGILGTVEGVLNFID